MLTLGDLMWPCYWKNTPLAKSWLTAGSGFGLPLCPPPPSPAPEKKWGFSTGSAQTGTAPCLVSPFWGHRLLNSGSSSRREEPSFYCSGRNPARGRTRERKRDGSTLHSGLQPSRGKLVQSMGHSHRGLPPTPRNAPWCVFQIKVNPI